jgi:hypothetical protein
MSMPPLGWVLYQSLLVLGWTTSLVFLIPMVFNAWSLALAWGLWKDERQERHCEAKEHEIPVEVDE